MKIQVLGKQRNLGVEDSSLTYFLHLQAVFRCSSSRLKAVSGGNLLFSLHNCPTKFSEAFQSVPSNFRTFVCACMYSQPQHVPNTCTKFVSKPPTTRHRPHKSQITLQGNDVNLWTSSIILELLKLYSSLSTIVDFGNVLATPYAMRTPLSSISISEWTLAQTNGF